MNTRNKHSKEKNLLKNYTNKMNKSSVEFKDERTRIATDILVTPNTITTSSSSINTIPMQNQYNNSIQGEITYETDEGSPFTKIMKVPNNTPVESPSRSPILEAESNQILDSNRNKISIPTEATDYLAPNKDKSISILKSSRERDVNKDNDNNNMTFRMENKKNYAAEVVCACQKNEQQKINEMEINYGNFIGKQLKNYNNKFNKIYNTSILPNQLSTSLSNSSDFNPSNQLVTETTSLIYSRHSYELNNMNNNFDGTKILDNGGKEKFITNLINNNNTEKDMNKQDHTMPKSKSTSSTSISLLSEPSSPMKSLENDGATLITIQNNDDNNNKYNTPMNTTTNNNINATGRDIDNNGSNKIDSSTNTKSKLTAEDTILKRHNIKLLNENGFNPAEFHLDNNKLGINSYIQPESNAEKIKITSWINSKGELYSLLNKKSSKEGEDKTNNDDNIIGKLNVQNSSTSSNNNGRDKANNNFQSTKDILNKSFPRDSEIYKSNITSAGSVVSNISDTRENNYAQDFVTSPPHSTSNDTIGIADSIYYTELTNTMKNKNNEDKINRKGSPQKIDRRNSIAYHKDTKDNNTNNHNNDSKNDNSGSNNRLVKSVNSKLNDLRTRVLSNPELIVLPNEKPQLDTPVPNVNDLDTAAAVLSTLRSSPFRFADRRSSSSAIQYSSTTTKQSCTNNLLVGTNSATSTIGNSRPHSSSFSSSFKGHNRPVLRIHRRESDTSEIPNADIKHNNSTVDTDVKLIQNTKIIEPVSNVPAKLIISEIPPKDRNVTWNKNGKRINKDSEPVKKTTTKKQKLNGKASTTTTNKKIESKRKPRVTNKTTTSKSRKKTERRKKTTKKKTLLNEKEFEIEGIPKLGNIVNEISRERDPNVTEDDEEAQMEKRILQTLKEDGIENTSSTSGTRSRTGCWICRLRKKKCTEEKPKCFNCERLNLECVYSLMRPDFVTDGAKKKMKLQEIKINTREAKRKAMKKRVGSNNSTDNSNKNSPTASISSVNEIEQVT